MQANAKQLRAFGLMIGGILVLLGLWPVVLRSGEVRLSPLVAAVLLVVPALAWPESLGPVYRFLIPLGRGLGWITAKVLLSILFYGVVTPLGFFRRIILGKDRLQRSYDPIAETYRKACQPRPSSHLKRQR